MCGRFTLALQKEIIAAEWGLSLENIPDHQARYNIAPTQDVLTMIRHYEKNSLTFMRWGLIPSWAKEESIGNRMINARAETLTEKTSFKNLFKNHRCLILADGYYEWKKDGPYKIPHYFRLKTGRLFAFAGLWSSWKNTGNKTLQSCTIITVESQASLRTIHERRPLILSPEDQMHWLDANCDARSLVKPVAESTIEFYPVSNRVNSPHQDDASLIQQSLLG